MLVSQSNREHSTGLNVKQEKACQSREYNQNGKEGALFLTHIYHSPLHKIVSRTRYLGSELKVPR